LEFEKALKLFDDIAFFSSFSKEERRFLASLDCNLIACRDKEILVKEGEQDLSLFILLEGRVSVGKQKFPGVVLSVLDPGAVFGEISMVRRRPRTTTIAADGETVVLRMDAEMIERLNPLLVNKIKNQLIELLMQRLDEMNDKLIHIAR